MNARIFGSLCAAIAIAAMVLCPVPAQAAAAGGSILIISDAEGVAGVCRQSLTEPASSELRQLLTGEVNAAVEGFLQGGAGEVVVWDGHDGSQTLSALTIHPRARVIMGSPSPSGLLGRKFAGIAFVGQHAKANSKAAVMAHSFSSLGIQNMWLNNKPVGEIEVWAAMAGQFGTPVIFLSGDQAAEADLHAIVPGVETVAVKESLAYYTCISMSAEAAREAISQGAMRAMKKLPDSRPYRLTGPVALRIEYSTRSTLPLNVGRLPGSEVIDARTVEYRGKDVLEAWTFYSAAR
jgi:D-amino peptidase